MLGRKVPLPLLADVKHYIAENTNPDGFITLSKLDRYNNRAIKQRALFELGYVANHTAQGKLTGYRKYKQKTL